MRRFLLQVLHSLLSNVIFVALIFLVVVKISLMNLLIQGYVLLRIPVPVQMFPHPSVIFKLYRIQIRLHRSNHRLLIPQANSSFLPKSIFSATPSLHTQSHDVSCKKLQNNNTTPAPARNTGPDVSKCI